MVVGPSADVTLSADRWTPHPPFGHLLPQGEKAMEPRTLSREAPLPLWERVAQLVAIAT